jgi:hypothetical protein
MPTVEKLQDILVKQKEAIKSLEAEIIDIENSDLMTENQNLKTELVKYRKVLEKEKSDNLKILEENKRLKNALYEQFYNEKIQILNMVNRKIDVYYTSNVQGEVNRLTALEVSTKRKINEIIVRLKANRVDIENEIYKEIEELRKQVNIKITHAREELARQTGTFSENKAGELAKLRQEKVTEEEIKSRVKQNNIESFIGLNIINKLGILLLIIGVIAASQFTYTKLPDMMKGVFAFAFGVVLLAAGELLNRKKPDIFSLGITSGGVALLYTAIALSFFKFEILDVYPALGLCILVTATAFVLSQRYNSQTIAAFAMVGGYLPIFSISGNKTIVYGAMVYFVILNILALITSINRKWNITAYIGFILNVMGSIYIYSVMISVRTYSASFSMDDFITILYIVFAFMVYILVPIMGSYRKKVSFKDTDIVLMALNTIISSVLLYLTFYALDLSDFTGLLAVIFAAIYISLGKFMEKFMVKEKKVRALFYITGLTFIVLIIPFQFGKVWLSLGWLIEGVSLLSYGIYKELKDFKQAGVIISLLCFAAFILFDVTNLHSSLFVYKYLAITIGSIIVLSILIYKKNLLGQPILAFKYSAIINLWFFSLYIIKAKLSLYISTMLLNNGLESDYLINAAMILASFLIAYSIPRISIIRDNTIKVISKVIYSIALIALFLLNFNSPVIGYIYEASTGISIIGTIELIVIMIISILALKDLILSFVIEGKLEIQWYPVIISFYFIVILTQNLITQYGLDFNNAIISIIYLITALAWIILGFVKRYGFVRRFGLGASILSVVKLFIIDLSFLSQGYRVVSYFIFGITLIAISFVYQHFSKKIDNVTEVVPDEEKTNI